MARAPGRLIAVAVAGAVALAGVAAGAGAVAAYDPVRALAGRYSHGFENGLIGGTRYRSEDIAEIVAVDSTHAYVRFELAFYNGHSCSLAGIAERQGDALVYRGPPDDAYVHGQPCTLTIRRRGAALVWDDADGTCRASCGARGSFINGDLPWASKRPIRYLPMLRRSVEYRDALAEWRGAR